MNNEKELKLAHTIIGILREGSVGNQAVWESVKSFPSDQSNWGQLIVQKALEIAITDAIQITKEDEENETI